MLANSASSLHLPWNQSDYYWLCVSESSAPFSGECISALKRFGVKESNAPDSYYCLRADRAWGEKWQGLVNILKGHHVLDSARASIVSGEQEPPIEQVMLNFRPASEITKIAESLWLGEALRDERIMCYLQPVMHTREKVFGYESFARVKATDGKVIGGWAICEASQSLGITYTIDRYLQVEAIKTFVSSNQSGFLFINFFPGFIQRPEKYLEGLTEAVQEYGIISKYIVLDFTRSEHKHDVQHLTRVTDYCRSKGYAISLDDLESTENARTLIKAIRPDFARIDMQLVQQVDTSHGRATIRDMVNIAHDSGVTVIAEGVETEDMMDSLKDLKVDLFQGYHFSPPVPVDELKTLGAAKASII